MDTSNLSIKIKRIRKVESLTRKEYSIATGVTVKTIEAIENKGTDPKGSYLKGICNAFPEYTLWLMLDETNIEIGQIKPVMKFKLKLARSMREQLNSSEISAFDRNNKQHIEELIKAQELEVDKIIDVGLGFDNYPL